jgi:hypothetical protein
MGLREDAEAARLKGIHDREAEKRAKECEREHRERERRAQVEMVARGVAYDVGIGELCEDVVWVTDPPIASGYNPTVHLHVRSLDGIWLRYSTYTRDHYSGVEHRWMVVQKCPVDDHWITSGSWASSLERIGAQLAVQKETLRKHLERSHPEYL